MNLYKKIVNLLCLIFEIIAAVSLAAMVIIVMGAVITRYFFSYTPGWSEEMARLMMVQFCFIAMVLGVRDKIHISLTVIVDHMPHKVILFFEITAKLLICVLGIMICGFAWPYILKLRFNRLPGSGLPVGFQYFIPALCGGLISLLTVYQIYDHFRHGTDEDQKSKDDLTKETAPL